MIDWEELVNGGVGGLIVGVFTALGIFVRLKRVENGAQTKDICDERHRTVDAQLKTLVELQKDISKRLDKLIEMHLKKD